MKALIARLSGQSIHMSRTLPTRARVCFEKCIAGVLVKEIDWAVDHGKLSYCSLIGGTFSGYALQGLKNSFASVKALSSPAEVQRKNQPFNLEPSHQNQRLSSASAATFSLKLVRLLLHKTRVKRLTKRL